MKGFVKQFNEELEGRSRLKILRKTRFRDSGGRKALDGLGLWFGTIIMELLKE